MAKKDMTTATAETVDEEKRLEVRAIVGTGSFLDETTHEVREYVSVQLVNPFPTDEGGEFRLVPKWKSDKGLFTLQARRRLKTGDNFEIVGEVTKNSYFSKKQKRVVTYPALYFQNFYAPGNIEMKVKDESQQAVFCFLLSELWGETLEYAEPESEQREDE